MEAFQETSSFEEEMLAQDREEVLAVLQIRFDNVPEHVERLIRGIRELDRLQRLILVAANAADLTVFIEELQESEDSFRLLGDRFNPLGMAGSNDQ
ncbi:MAG: hypothetical protein K0R75_510 [Paenibacillaceae bacterium]|nr:hypothetical protein [Paenibacillaceae bacterium]